MLTKFGRAAEACAGRGFQAVARDCERRDDSAVIVWDGAEGQGGALGTHPPRRDSRGVEESFEEGDVAVGHDGELCEDRIGFPGKDAHPGEIGETGRLGAALATRE